jgi:hypothetical protein
MLGSLKCEYPGLSPDVINSILDGIQASIRQKVKGQCHECLGLSSNVINSIVDGIQASIDRSYRDSITSTRVAHLIGTVNFTQDCRLHQKNLKEKYHEKPVFRIRIH